MLRGTVGQHTLTPAAAQVSARSLRVRYLEMKKAGTEFLTSSDGHDSEPFQELEAPIADRYIRLILYSCGAPEKLGF